MERKVTLTFVRLKTKVSKLNALQVVVRSTDDKRKWFKGITEKVLKD